MSEYLINIKAIANSDLSKDELESKLVIALYDIDNNVMVLDGQNDNIEIIDYYFTDAEILDITEE